MHVRDLSSDARMVQRAQYHPGFASMYFFAEQQPAGCRSRDISPQCDNPAPLKRRSAGMHSRQNEGLYTVMESKIRNQIQGRFISNHPDSGRRLIAIHHRIKAGLICFIHSIDGIFK